MVLKAWSCSVHFTVVHCRSLVRNWKIAHHRWVTAHRPAVYSPAGRCAETVDICCSSTEGNLCRNLLCLVSQCTDCDCTEVSQVTWEMLSFLLAESVPLWHDYIHSQWINNTIGTAEIIQMCFAVTAESIRYVQYWCHMILILYYFWAATSLTMKKNAVTHEG